MLEKGSKWFLPEELAKSEVEFRNKAKMEPADKRNDFGSYRELLQKYQDSGIEQHNLTGQKARCYANILRKVVEKYFGGEKLRLADVGCGAGFLTWEIFRLFSSTDVLGCDISHDAITYARDHFPGPSFKVEAITSHTTFADKFQVIHAREFYSFTRTCDLDHQYEYVSMFLRNLTPGGILIISMIDRPPSLFQNLEGLHQRLKREHALRNLDLQYIPFLGLPGASQWLPLSVFLSKAVRNILGKPATRMAILQTV